MNSTYSYERYSRQIALNRFGEVGQQKLLNAKVLMIGVGGLGCPALQYLTAAGIGTIGMVDDDLVSLNNLHRQILFSTDDIGKLKTERANHRLQQLNPEIRIIAFPQKLTTHNAIEIINDFDFIIDGTDNFATRYLINDACTLLNKPLIYGAVSTYEGQVAVFNYKKNKEAVAINYRDLFPHPPQNGEVMNCESAGVLGILPGIVGMLMANETIKLIAEIGEPLTNKIFTYNSLNNQTYLFQITKNSEADLLIPKSIAAFKQMDYAALCTPNSHLEIDATTFDRLIKNENVDFIDVRQPDEEPEVNEFAHLKMSLAQLEENVAVIKKETVVVFCQSGARSLQGAKTLSSIFKNTKKIYSLKNGIGAWKQTKA